MSRPERCCWCTKLGLNRCLLTFVVLYTPLLVRTGTPSAVLLPWNWCIFHKALQMFEINTHLHLKAHYFDEKQEIDGTLSHFIYANVGGLQSTFA